MSRYVNIDQIIADIYEKWGCDPAYCVGVSDADAHEAKLDADHVEFLRSKPYIDIVRCKECKYCDTFPNQSDATMPLKCLNIRYGGVCPDWFCEHGERREPDEKSKTR